MKKLAILGLISSVFMTSCIVDNDYYHTPEPIYDTYTYVENFNDNRNGWEFIDRVYGAEGYISGGTYKIDYYDDYEPAYYVTQQMSYNYNDEFIIETKFGSDNEMGLIFGANPSRGAYGYSINIDVDGYVRMYDEGGNGYGSDVVEIVAPFTHSSIRDRGDWNTVRIHQVRNEWRVYINGREVITMPAQRMKGSGVGFVVVPYTLGEVDYLDVTGFY